jgi:hypothetical protein
MQPCVTSTCKLIEAEDALVHPALGDHENTIGELLDMSHFDEVYLKALILV